MLAQAFLRFDQAEILARLEVHEAAAGPICSVADVYNDPHLRARGSIVGIHDDELGCDLHMQNAIGLLSRTPARIDSPGPALGADNREILVGELGFAADELVAAGLAL